MCIGALCPGVTLVIPPRSASVLVCSRGCLRGPSAAGKEASRAPGRRISTVQAYGRSAPPQPPWPGASGPRARPSGGAVSEKRETARNPRKFRTVGLLRAQRNFGGGRRAEGTTVVMLPVGVRGYNLSAVRNGSLYVRGCCVLGSGVTGQRRTINVNDTYCNTAEQRVPTYTEDQLGKCPQC